MGHAKLELSCLIFASWLGWIGFAQGVLSSEPASQNWSYADQTGWSSIDGSHCSSNDSLQSPIDIPRAIANTYARNVTLDKIPEGLRLGNVTWVISETSVNVTMSKGPTTWTVETFPPYGEGINFEGDLFDLVSITFKSPSEHTFDGIRADFEVQLNHLSQILYANGHKRLVASIRFNAAKEVKRNFWLNTIWRMAMTHNRSAPSSFMIGNPYTELVPPDRSFVAYKGSTTEPPCHAADWLVHIQPDLMSYEELVMFRASLNDEQASLLGTVSKNQSESDTFGYAFNNRDIQDSGSRKLKLYRMSNVPKHEGPSSLDIEVKQSHSFWREPLLWLLAIAALIALVCICFAFLRKLRERCVGNIDSEESEDYMGPQHGGMQSQKGFMMQPMMPQFRPPGPPYAPFPQAYANAEPPRAGYGYPDQIRFG